MREQLHPSDTATTERPLPPVSATPSVPDLLSRIEATADRILHLTADGLCV